MRRSWILALALLGSALGGAAQAPVLPAAWGDRIYPRLGQAGLDVTHYDVALRVPQPGTRTLQAEVTLSAQATRPLPLLSLDYLGPAVQGVTWNGAAVPFERAGEKLLIRRALTPGTTARVTVRLSGPAGRVPDPDLPVDLGWQALPGQGAQPGVNFSFSEPDGTRAFLPVNDHPADPATFTLRVTVPQGVTAAASGVHTRVQDTPQGRTFTFEQREAIPTYALSVHVGPLERVDRPAVQVAGKTVQVRDYFPPGIPPNIRAPYERTGEILRVLGEWFGPYPFAVYGSAVVRPALPALETATLSTMPVTSSNVRVIVHEAAHQWFGNSVPLGDWSDTWLNEGFATYAELLWVQAQGEGEAAVVQRWRDSVQSGPTRPLVARTAAELFDRSAYLRGALALHALRAEVGDGPFRTFLQTYARERAGQPTRTADLLALARRVLGPDAEGVLRAWVESPGLPPLP
ncbi:M1 family metallopeptidase [Deinococcus arcticus]|uniref:Aminopeptidase N n=1 Tax=Deinococcus arcticus TaxID=2136176 RepID=A0A2T3W477_9DEIO|nr:M1 family metallopeptidase [Deinococcus arcticus]PTA66659.1 zinc metalloprotease [Deinococcus arcticus]